MIIVCYIVLLIHIFENMFAHIFTDRAPKQRKKYKSRFIESLFSILEVTYFSVSDLFISYSPRNIST